MRWESCIDINTVRFFSQNCSGSFAAIERSSRWKRKMKKSIIAYTLLLFCASNIAMFFWYAPVVDAHSCDYPDFVLLDYDLISSANSLQVYTYDGQSVQYQSELFDTESGHNFVHGFGVGPQMGIYVSGYDGADFIRVYDGNPDSGSFKSELARLTDPLLSALGDGLAIDPATGMLYTLTGFQTAIHAYDPAMPTQPARQIADLPQTSSQYSQFGIEVGPDGRIYVMTLDDTIEVYDPTELVGDSYEGVYASGTGTGPYGARDLAFGPDGHLYTTGSFSPSAGRARVARFQGPAGSNPGAFMDEMLVDDSRSEWPHGLTFHPVTGELFIANFSVNGGIHVYNYAPGFQSPKLVVEHNNPNNPDGLPKDIQFLACPTETSAQTVTEATAGTNGGGSVPTWLPISAVLVIASLLIWGVNVWYSRRRQLPLNLLP